MQDNLKEYDVYAQKQIVKDIDARSLNGTYIYFAAWLLIGGLTGFYVDNLLTYLSVAAIFILQGIMRVIAFWYFSKVSPSAHSFRKYWQYFNVLLPAFLYSVLLSLAFYLPQFNTLFLYIMLIIFALLSAGTINFAPIKKLSISFVLALTLLPFITATFFTSDRYIEGLMLALYAFYMVILAIRLNKEYILNLQQKYQLNKVNQQDSLTGIANRRCFDETFKIAWKLGLRSKASLCLILIDIDFFKRVNDQYGHAAGDKVIINVANIIRASCRRESDLIARIGGEEYAILLNNYDSKDIQNFTENIRAQIEAAKLIFDGATIPVTASFGVAFTTPTLQKSLSNLFKFADKNLYSAKETGRNRVVIGEY